MQVLDGQKGGHGPSEGLGRPAASVHLVALQGRGERVTRQDARAALEEAAAAARGERRCLDRVMSPEGLQIFRRV